MTEPNPSGYLIVLYSCLKSNTSFARVRHGVPWDISVREPSKSFQIKYFPNILSVFDMLRSGDCREDLTNLAVVVTTAGKFILGLSKTFVLCGLPRRECNPRSFFSSLFPSSPLPDPSSSSPSSLSPSLPSPLLLLADTSPGFLCVRVLIHVCA